MAKVEVERSEITYKVTLTENEFWTVLAVLGSAHEGEALADFRSWADSRVPESVVPNNPYVTLYQAVGRA